MPRRWRGRRRLVHGCRARGRRRGRKLCCCRRAEPGCGSADDGGRRRKLSGDASDEGCGRVCRGRRGILRRGRRRSGDANGYRGRGSRGHRHDARPHCVTDDVAADPESGNNSRGLRQRRRRGRRRRHHHHCPRPRHTCPCWRRHVPILEEEEGYRRHEGRTRDEALVVRQGRGGPRRRGRHRGAHGDADGRPRAALRDSDGAPCRRAAAAQYVSHAVYERVSRAQPRGAPGALQQGGRSITSAARN